jgi:hypothetical protein
MTDRLSVAAYRVAPMVYERNGQRFDHAKHVDQCFLCGRGLTDAGMANGKVVHTNTAYEFIPAGAALAAGEESQGLFPIGSDCAKRLPAAYVVSPS